MFEHIWYHQTHYYVCEVKFSTHWLACKCSKVFSLMNMYLTSDLLQSDYICVDLIPNSDTDCITVDSSVSLYLTYYIIIAISKPVREQSDFFNAF